MLELNSFSFLRFQLLPIIKCILVRRVSQEVPASPFLKSSKVLSSPGSPYFFIKYLTDLLNSWRKKRPESAYFFCTLKGKKLSIRCLQQMVKRYAQKAGLNKRISPHALRHYVDCYIVVSSP